MQIQAISEKERGQWNEFLMGTAECPILQSYEWGEFKAHFGWEPIRLAVVEGNRIKAGISILKRKVPFLGKSIFYAPRGPVVDLHDQETVDYLLAAVKEEARKNKALLLKIDPGIREEPLDFARGKVRGVREELIRSGFRRAKKQIQPRATIRLDLTKSLDEIMAGFESKTRYNVRLGEKKKVVVEEDKTLEGVRAFYCIHEETSKREKFLVHPLSYYEKLQEILVERSLGAVFLAYFEDKPIAGIFVFTFGHRVWYMYGASLSAHRQVMPNHVLHWHAIQWAKKQGYTSYDLWGIPAQPASDHPLFGVYRFKKGFGGEIVKLIGVYDLPYNPFLYLLFDKGVNFYQGMHSLIKKGKMSDSLEE